MTTTRSHIVLGVDACPAGWFATIVDDTDTRTACYDTFDELSDTHADADRILVDIPIGLPEDARRQCDIVAKNLLGSRGASVFYPPCRVAAEQDDYESANDKHRAHLEHGLSQQAYSISEKILAVNDVVDTYDGVIRESHPELCFAALNNQPVAYSKSTVRGRHLRMHLLENTPLPARRLYREAIGDHLRKDVRRDDILDAIVLAVAAYDDELTTTPTGPGNGPRIYYPDFAVPSAEFE